MRTVLALTVGLALSAAGAQTADIRSENPTLTCGNQGPNTFYFPAKTFAESYEGADEFRREWYSRHLAAMNEPSLTCDSRVNTEAFRFLWLRSSRYPIVIRVTRLAEGGLLTAVVLDGKGGHAPGKVLQSVEKRLTEDDWVSIQKMSEAVGFWTMPTSEEHRTKILPDGSVEIEIRGDGAQWIVEGLQPDKYKIVDRWGGLDGIRAFGLKFLELSGIELPADDVY